MGIDPDTLSDMDAKVMDFSKRDEAGAKAWKDIWSAGQGVGTIHEILPARALVLRLEDEYRAVASGLLT